MKEKENINSGHRDRLRERFFTVGLDGFKPHEVLELLLFICIPRRDTKDKAKEILAHFDNDFHKLLAAEKDDFTGLDLTDSTITLIKLVREINIYQKKLNLKQKKIIDSTIEAYDYLKDYYRGLHKEEFVVIYLDIRGKVLAINSEFQGTINEARIYVREIVKQCIKHNAASIIISHNHPSGSLEPTTADLNITERIKSALALVDIKLIDHILVGENDFYSFKEYGLL